MLTIPQAQQRLVVSYPGAQHNVKKLVDAGILEQLVESSHPRVFIAKDILNVLGEEKA